MKTTCYIKFKLILQKRQNFKILLKSKFKNSNFKIAKASQPRDLLKGGILVVEEKISANLPCSLF